MGRGWFPGSAVLRLCTFTTEGPLQSLVRELRTHKQHGVAKKKRNKKGGKKKTTYYQYFNSVD